MNTNATGIIFSNMHDEELHEITANRTMGSVPFGGRYRLIDFTLSNLKNSGVTNVGVITKSNYQSLIDHLKSGKEWDLSRKRGGLFLFPPYGRHNSGFYRNKIEALFGIMTFIRKETNDYFLISDCDVICNMDWIRALNYHIEKHADITTIYYEKEPDPYPENPETTYTVSEQGYVTDLMVGQKIKVKSKVGTNMWIIGRNLLITLIEDAIAHNYEDFERDIMQRKLNYLKIAAYKFEGYLRKINSITDFFQTNMDLLTPSVQKDLFHRYGKIYTKILDDIPTLYSSEASAINCLIANGCKIEGTVENSILFRGVRVGKGAKISNSIIMQGSNIGEFATLNYVITDKDVTINNQRILMGYETNPVYIKKSSII